MADEITPEAFEKLQNDLAAAVAASTGFQESITKLEENNKTLLQEKKDAKTAAQLAVEEAARKGGDVEALEASWKEKLASETASRDEKLSEYQKTIQKMTVGSAAQSMAGELALPGSADVLLPHIERRLQVEMTDGGPLVRVLDKDGKPSASSIEDLRKEIESDAAFAPLLLGSKASGSGDVGKKGGSTNSQSMKRSEYEALPLNEKSAIGAKIGKKEIVLVDD